MRSQHRAKARVAKVLALAREVFHDQAKARGFLDRPHPMLNGRAPRDVARSSRAGANAVINLLGRAAYGGGV